jgi:xanthine/CO dehydrogenase XdhC/CoxF family maturation factor
MSVRQIIRTFEAWRAGGEPIVLATVYDTLGSTYSKPGHRVLIAASGDYQGLVSGGCLEGDLAERARAVIASGRPVAVTYDLRDEADELWGLGVGCNGLIRVFLQPLSSAREYQPFAAIAERLVGSSASAVATVIESSDARAEPGATLIAHGGAYESWGFDAALAARISAPTLEVLASRSPRLVREAGLTVLYAPLTPVPKLLVLGAGLDAIPLVGMAEDLGWFVTVADHRPGYLQRGGFARADRALVVEPGALASSLPLAEFDAIVVMSHHLVTDRKYLAELATVGARYLGVLGPRGRRDRLLAELETAQLGARLKGPVGLDIGADSPEAIALSILAEIQATLSGR